MGKGTAVEGFRNPAEGVDTDAEEVAGVDKVLSNRNTESVDLEEEEECSDSSNRDYSRNRYNTLVVVVVVVVDYFVVVDNDNVDYWTSNIHLSYLLVVYIKLLTKLYLCVVVVVVTHTLETYKQTRSMTYRGKVSWAV